MPQATRDAVAAYQRGETAEAERLCRSALDAQPDYFDALYLSGIIAEQTGRAEEAVELLSKAVAVKPGIADA
ncbi:MAG TPA: tetratricopeptide repeat protein, partial [Dehalococcoidia bacterium]|nr:tetratricopeptide repeat protein [Dehalococcoidia bacterium]